MAIYTVEAPDGNQIKLEGPEGASQEEIIKQAQALYQPTQAQTETPVNKDAGVAGAIGRTALGVAQGAVVDPLLGATQLIGHLLGQGKTVDELVNKESDAYKAIRKELGGEGTDVSRIVGMVAPALLSGGTSLATKAPQAASVLSKLTTPIGLAERLPVSGNMAKAALTGVEQAALAPVEEQQNKVDYAGNKLSNVITGGVLGGTLGALPKFLTPEAGSVGEKLAAEGKGTLGQQINSPALQKFERNAISNLPGGAGVVAKQKIGQEALDQTNREGYADLYNGLKLDKSEGVKSITDDLMNAARQRAATNTEAGVKSADTLEKMAAYINSNVGTRPIPKLVQDPVTRVFSLETAPGITRTVEDRDVYHVIQNLKAEKEAAYTGPNADHEVGRLLKSTIDKLKTEIGAQNPGSGFKEKIAQLDKHYAQAKELKKMGTKELASLGRHVLTGGEIWAALQGGPGAAAAATAFAIPQLFKYPGFTRGLGSGLGAAAVPTALQGSRTSTDVGRKQGGLINSKYKKGGLSW
jgi:hypothetical protein